MTTVWWFHTIHDSSISQQKVMAPRLMGVLWWVFLLVILNFCFTTGYQM
ncbi:hypothetical protein RF240_18415 [Dickeya dadantii]